MDSSPGFGSIATDSRPVKTRFPFGSSSLGLTSPVTVTRRLINQKARGRTLVLPLIVDSRFQVLFHSPPGVLFTFPSRYYALSVANEYFALEGGPPCFPQGFSCPVVLWILTGQLCLSPTGLLPSAADLSRSLRLGLADVL